MTAADAGWYESAMTPTAARAFQAAFLRRIGGDQPLRALFDHLPGVAFAIKDHDSRVVCANRAVFGKFGLRDEHEIIGSRDADRYPARMAAVFRASDREVLDHGRAVRDRLEVWFTAEGALDWCVVTKLPLHDRQGRIIGVMLAMRPWQGMRRRLPGDDVIAGLIERIRTNPGLPWRVAALARRAGVSARQLQRRIHADFGMALKEFILCARIQAGAQALRHSTRPLAAIATHCGFHDPSAFTRAFRARTGTTPERFRREHPPG